MPSRSTLTLPAHAAPLTGPDRARARAALDPQRLQAALEAMQQSRFADAFAQLAPLADEGHPQAARMALLFAQRGTRLFGGRYEASDARQRAWRRAAAV